MSWWSVTQLHRGTDHYSNCSLLLSCQVSFLMNRILVNLLAWSIHVYRVHTSTMAMWHTAPKLLIQQCRSVGWDLVQSYCQQMSSHSIGTAATQRSLASRWTACNKLSVYMTLSFFYTLLLLLIVQNERIQLPSSTHTHFLSRPANVLLPLCSFPPCIGWGKTSFYFHFHIRHFRHLLNETGDAQAFPRNGWENN